MTQPKTDERHYYEPSSDVGSLLQQLDRVINEERQERLVLPQDRYAFLPRPD
jgi:hypothetical protein